MKLYEVDGVTSLVLYRQYKVKREELTRTFKNPLTAASLSQRQQVKWALLKQLIASPNSIELKIKYELLQEVERG